MLFSKGTQSEGERGIGARLKSPHAKAGSRRRDKYFRLLASVKVGNIDVAEYLIKKGLAKEYDGGSKVW